jgi:GT2 family glycosyltransferase
MTEVNRAEPSTEPQDADGALPAIALSDAAMLDVDARADSAAQPPLPKERARTRASKSKEAPASPTRQQAARGTAEAKPRTPTPRGRKDRASAAERPAPRPDSPGITTSFRGSVAELHLSEPVPIVGVVFDTHLLPPSDWKITGGRTLRIECPPIAFDTEPHRLRLLRDGESAEDSGEAHAPPLEVKFRSQYRGWIDSIDESGVRGWLYDSLRPETELRLQVRCGTADPFEVMTSIERPDVKPIEPRVAGSGFDIVLPPRAAHAGPELIILTVAGSGFQPFPPLLRGATLPAAVTATTAAARALGRTPEGLLFSTTLLPTIMQALTGGDTRLPDALRGTLQLNGTRPLVRRCAPRVDIVIPVYGGRDETLACIESVIAARGQVPQRIVVIDDCSPDPKLSAALAELGAAGRIHYLRNEANLGFVATANRGMALDAEADVVLLNSDTVVPPGFVDRLYRAAYSDSAIATVTPLSNNATIFSLPTMMGSKAPWDLSTPELDAICQEVNAGQVRDVPTAHGFCMFIKRAALDDVGLFDVETFGTGYGEENDFSLRAWHRGWRNVGTGDVFVTHIGSVSFKELREQLVGANLQKLGLRYPYYAALVDDFLRNDPLHELRNNVQKALWRRHERIAVVITLALGGGTVQHAEDMMSRLATEGWLVLMLAMMPGEDGRLAPRLRRWRSTEDLAYPHATPLAKRLADILDLAPKIIHVQHLIDLPDGVAEFVRNCDIPYAVTLHDFFYGCPKVTLLDAGGTYCGMPPASKCTICVQQGPIHANVHPSLHTYAEIGEVWRSKWEGFLRDATQVIAPSQDTAERYAKLFPGLAVTVRPHFAPLQRRRALRQKLPFVEGGLRVALAGAIGPQKGAAQLVELARHCTRWHDDLRFVVIGHADREKELKRHLNIEILGAYKPDAVQDALARAQCRVALFLSVFPETFCYTLSEVLEASLVPVAYDFGAIGERMRALGVGVLVPYGAPPEQIVAAIRKAAQMQVSVPREALYGQYGTLLADYYDPALADLTEASPPPDTPRALTVPRGLHDDFWCEGEVALHLWHARSMTGLAAAFWLPPSAPPQGVEITANGVMLARRFLNPGEVTRIVCQIAEGGARRLEVALRFDFVFRLAPPDVRSCAAILHELAVNEGGVWQRIELPHATLRRAAA